MEAPLARAAGDQALWLLAGGVLIGCAAFVYGFVLWRRRRMIEDTPTSRVRSMALGRVELSGVARAKDELRAPLSGIACVWFRYRIEKETGSGKNRRWSTIDSGDSSDWPFCLQDETGTVRIEPKGASIEIADQWQETDPELSGPLANFVLERGLRVHGLFGGASRLRVREARLHDGDALYVHGIAQSRPGLREERRIELAGRLAELKRDAKRMAAVDGDGDGVVSAEEWDVARLRVVTEVDAAPIEDAIAVAVDPLDNAPFLISNGCERSLVRALGWRAAAAVFGGATLALFCLHFWLERFRSIGRI